MPTTTEPTRQASLTKRQAAVFEFIRDKIQNRGYGPTVREIGERFQISSPNGVMCHLKALEKKGLIIRAPNRSRAIQLADHAKSGTFGAHSTAAETSASADAGHSVASRSLPSSELPLAGRVAAGVLHEAIEQDESIDFGSMFAKQINLCWKFAVIR